jgi:heme oxygenase
VGRLLDRLTEETRAFQNELDAEAEVMLGGSVAGYRRFLLQTYGFVVPVERALMASPGLERYFDKRRLRKQQLLEHDLQAMNVRETTGGASVPSLANLHDALGWAYVVERNALTHPQLYRRLAGTIPGEIAFASSYLKCYFGGFGSGVGEMWRSFTDDLEAAVWEGAQSDRVVDAAKAAYRTYERWRANSTSLRAESAS